MVRRLIMRKDLEGSVRGLNNALLGLRALSIAQMRVYSRTYRLTCPVRRVSVFV
jgi:hypothetical protein